jgi:hypothetical protein
MPNAGSLRAVGVIVLVGALLSGCNAATVEAEPHPAGPKPVATEAGSPAAEEWAGVDEELPPPGTEVASGEFTSATGTAIGRVSLVTNDTRHIDVRFEDFSVENGPELRVYLLPGRLGPRDPVTRPGDISLELGKLISPTGSQEYVFGDPWVWGEGDPSFFRTLAVISYGALAEQSTEPATAVAPLSWSFPAPRAVLAVDSGPTGGARGDVVSDGGEPVSYTVASNDLLAEVAARFGISVSDLLWLNPPRGKHQALAGEVLNLSAAER